MVIAIIKDLAAAHSLILINPALQVFDVHLSC
jgi:hypothetical protein